MSEYIDDKFYHNIIKSNNGYVISRNGESYGWYDDIRLALYDRDRLESVDYDLEEWYYLPIRNNPYEHMRLPPVGLRSYRQYISNTHNGWRIRKRINGEYVHFGTYSSLDDAIEYRDELIRNGWRR